MSLHLYRLIIIILIVLPIPISSCHLFGPPNPPEIIQITGIDPKGDLIMEDVGGKSARIFNVKAGTTINWQLKNSDISSIDKIYKKRFWFGAI